MSNKTRSCDHIKVGDPLWNGATVSEALASKYNSLQDEIKVYIDAERPVPEKLLHDSFILIRDGK